MLTTENVRTRTDEEEVAIRVGPGRNRGLRDYMPLEEEILVVGIFDEDEDLEDIWWQIQPEDYDETEADRYWVAEEDVEENGDCEAVEEAAASAYIRAASPILTPETVTTSGGANWGECGSCNNCAAPDNECVQSPEGECIWDPGKCGAPDATAVVCEWVFVSSCCLGVVAVRETWVNTCTGQEEYRSGGLCSGEPSC
jgi:hypothetical protein